MIGFSLAEIGVIATVSFLICVLATSLAMESAALFLPAFLLVFPAIIPTFPTLGPNDAIGITLVIMFFGQTSTLLRYWYQGQVAVRVAAPALAMTVPLAVIGRLFSYLVPPSWLLVIFAGLLFVLAGGVYRANERTPAEQDTAHLESAPEVNQNLVHADTNQTTAVVADGLASDNEGGGRRSVRDNAIPSVAFGRRDRAMFGTGGALAGLIGFGIGEISNTSLHLGKGIPIKYSTGTSTLILYFTLLTATIVNVTILQFGLLGSDGAVAVPWELAVIVAPIVLVGGQVGAYVNARLPDHLVVKLLVGAYLFVGFVTVSRLFA